MPKTREEILTKVRYAISKYSFTPEELSTPTSTDMLALIATFSKFLARLSFTKLSILFYIGSQGSAYMSSIVTLTQKDISTISHIMREMTEADLVEKINIYSQNDRRMYKLSPQGVSFFKEVFAFYQQNLNFVSSFLACEKATSDTTSPDLQ